MPSAAGAVRPSQLEALREAPPPRVLVVWDAFLQVLPGAWGGSSRHGVLPVQSEGNPEARVQPQGHIHRPSSERTDWLPVCTAHPEGGRNSPPFPSPAVPGDDVVHTPRRAVIIVINDKPGPHLPPELFGTKKILNNFILLDTWEIWTRFTK